MEGMMDIRELHDIIYRALFDMDTRALLIHFGLSADCYNDPDDDALLDNMGTLALKAVSAVHTVHVHWLVAQPRKVSTREVKTALRAQANMVAKLYKARAKELGGELLTEMRL
jgi:hypothetical protein